MALEGKDNFLLEMGNPVKLILLLEEVLEQKLKLTQDPYL